MSVEGIDLGKYQLGWHDDDGYVYKPAKGLSESVVRDISTYKNEPEWMTRFRVNALNRFERKPMLEWFARNMPDLDFDDIYYYIKPTDHQVSDWDMLPEGMKTTYERLGIPEAERKFLAGVTAQYESEVVYHKNREDLAAMGVLFTDMDSALREYPEIVQQYLGTVIPPGDNKFAALNSAVWSGGSFIYVPPGVHVDMPLQAYFRINAENSGQFERTLIIADEGASVHYVEGCLLADAPIACADGSRQVVQDVQVGDLVLDADGRVTEVTALMERDYDGDVHRLVPLSGLNALEVTSEHPLWVVPRCTVVSRARRRGPSGKEWQPEVATTRLAKARPQWVRAEAVREGDFLFYPEPRVDPAPALHPSLVRLAGYYLAEGSAQLINGCKALTFSFAEHEDGYIEEVRDLCADLWGKRGSVHHARDRHAKTVTVYTNAGYHTMATHVGTRSATKRLSSLFLGQDVPALVALVDAYIKGDGSRGRVRGDGDECRHQIRCNTTSREWASQLQGILARAGIFATASVCRPGGPATILGREVTRQPLYVVQWTAEGISGIGAPGARAPGDRNQVRKVRGGWLVPIKRIETRPFHGRVYNFSTTSETYTVNGFAVHNCSAPVYSSDSLHSAVVELIAKPGARIRYTTIQNWSPNVYNLVTKRARAEDEATVEWIDGNLGSKLTMKYPAVVLAGPKAHGEVLSVAYAGAGQHQDAGAKMTHAAPETTSIIDSKSISKDGGRTTYRGLVRVDDGAYGVKSHVRCDALILDEDSRSDTYPYMEIAEADARVGHEASVSKVGDDQLFYLMSRGLDEQQAMAMIVNGFIEPVTKTLPMEYAVELSRLIELNMEGAVG